MTEFDMLPNALPQPTKQYARKYIVKRECDVSKAFRGKFYRKGAELRLPIYLDSKLQNKLERLARRKNKDVGEMVDQLLRKDVEFLEELL